MKHFLRKTFLVLLGGVLCSLSATAQNTKTVGAEDNTTGPWTVFSDGYDIKTDETIQNLRQIIEKVREALPDTRIYLETLFPVNHQFETGRPTDTILAINDRLPKLAEKTNCTLIDTYSRFAENGEMPSRYTVDGVHLNGTGVTRWIEFLTPWIRE